MPINIIRPAGLREDDLKKIEGMEEHGNEWHLLDFVDDDMLDVYKKTEYPELLRDRVKTMIRNNYPELEDEDTLLESLTALIYKMQTVDSGEFKPFVREDTTITVLFDDEETPVEGVNAEFIIKLDEKLDREDITDANGEIVADLLDEVVYVYKINHPDYLPEEGEFTVETPYEVNIIYANEDVLGTLLEEQAEMDFQFELEFEDMRELGDVTVLDVDGNPVVGAEVYMEHSTNPDLFTGNYTTDDNGEYNFLALRNESMKYEIIYDGVHSKGEFMHEEPYEYTLTFIDSEPEKEEENQLSVLLDGIEFTT